MRIVNLQASNLKRLIAVDISPNGDVVEIVGKNGAGKSSILDAIFWALSGTKDITSKPIRKGEDKATIKLDLGELIVTRTFNAQDDGSYTTSLKVENGEGARYPSPQSMMDALVGELTFDPLTFANSAPKEQFETLKRLTGLDFGELERLNRLDYDERTIVNRRARDLKAAADAMIVPDDAPTEEVDVSALSAEIGNAASANTERNRRADNREVAETRIAAIQDQIRVLTDEMHGLQQRLAAAPPLPDLIDVSELQAKLDAGIAANRLAGLAKRKAETLAQAEEAEKDSATITARMAEREATKRQMIETAKMPVEGLGFGDGEITFNEMPFDQASSAEQLRVSIAIAAASNSKLRIIRCKDGALLDHDSMQMLAAFAKEHDLQVWVERIEGDAPGAIVIEDGSVKQ